LNHRFILISGYPGCGKTTFASWLASEKNFYNLDMERGGIDKDGLREVWDSFYSGTDRTSFINRIQSNKRSVVLDWGFPPDCIEVVRALQQQGAEIWWFEGDRLAARQRFIRRGTQHVGEFDNTVGRVCAAWAAIAPIFETNVIRSINPDASFMPHEDIWLRLTGKET
jgi:hypothetical protein